MIQSDHDKIPVGAIRFHHVSKRFHVMKRAAPRLGAWVLAKAFEYFRREPFTALDDVSFSVEPGEMVGLLGHNGAGKSTILKLIAGITQPDAGQVQARGNVASLLELGVGFHEELTGMENIFYNGAMMGLSKQQILGRLSDIIAFSGIADFLYEPVKHYSSGMYSRLACSVALHLDPEIILVDEILAVGDADFQQRGILKILELHERGVTVLLVTHESATARDICDRLIWIDHGKLREEGDPRTVHTNFLKSMLNQTLDKTIFHESPEAANGARKLRIEGMRFLVDGIESEAIETGQPARLELAVSGQGACDAGLMWRWTDGRVLTEDFSGPLQVDGDRTLIYEIPRWPLMRSKIQVSAILANPEHTSLFDRTDDLLTIDVQTPGAPDVDILVQPKAEWNFERLE